MTEDKTPDLTPAQRIRADAKEATRKALLAAGLAETIEHGGAVPSIEDMCARAGYTRGAFYAYFKSRSDFVAQMFDWVVGDIFMAIFRSAGEGDADLPTILTRFTDALVKDDWPDVPDIRATYTSVLAGARESERVRTKHTALLKEAVARLAKAVEEGQQAGAIAKDLDSRRTGEMIMVVAIGAIVWDRIEVPIDVRAITDMLLSLLRLPSS